MLINLGGLKDEAAANAYRIKGEELLDDTLVISQDLYKKVEHSL